MEEWINQNQSCYVVAANVHLVMSAYWNDAYQKIINTAALITPDGMPLVWGLRWLGIVKQTRVYGPDLMLACCQRAAEKQIPVFFYGGTEGMLSQLTQFLLQQFPTLAIAGSYAPPFRLLNSEEEANIREIIHNSGARIVFVGLGCPKQEAWMARQQGNLQAVMMGVGAAFSFHSGEVSQAPRWMMARGLEWLYRLMMEPGRLWQRYLVTNPAFVLLFSWQLLKTRLKR
ncbi:MAG: WecB/TagA/CpsF family glycosyltransferase [Snowella sp.]|nr:WecB/TagA/CpsF family glycosyltransferase [Snowella sp.]